jgi:hypothetical protein
MVIIYYPKAAAVKVMFSKIRRASGGEFSIFASKKPVFRNLCKFLAIKAQDGLGHHPKKPSVGFCLFGYGPTNFHGVRSPEP